MSVRATKPMLLCAAAALLAIAWAQSSAAGDRIYRWTDKSGQENFTDDINNVPEPYKSKFKKEDEERKARQKPTEKQASPSVKPTNSAEKPQVQPKVLEAPANVPAMPQKPDESELQSTSDGRKEMLRSEKDKSKGPPPPDFKPSPKYSGSSSGSATKTKAPPVKEPAVNADGESKPVQYSKKDDYNKRIAELKDQLEKKNEEYEYAVKWEMMVHTPKYTQDKLRLLDEMKAIRERISDYENKLNDLDKPKPE